MKTAPLTRAAKRLATLCIVLAVGAGISLAMSSSPKTPPASKPVASKVKAPLEVSYKAPPKIDVGRSADVTVTFTARSGVENLQVLFIPGEGVSLADEGTISLGDLEKGKKARASFTATVTQEGSHHVNVSFSGLFEGVRMGGSSAVGLTTGKPGKAKRKPGKIVVDDSGEKLMEMKGGLR